MAKFYSRNGGVKLSQMPFGEVTEQNMPLDILVVDTIGDYNRFRLKVVASDERMAEKIIFGVMRQVYVPLTITQSAYCLFDDVTIGGYTLFDTTCGVSNAGNNTYIVCARGHLNYVPVAKERW